jgi:hypothetical protein
VDWLSGVPSSFVTWLQAVFSMAAGFALNEVSQLIRLRRKDRRAAGPVLSDLFEIRHKIIALDAWKREFTTHFPIPAQAQLQLQNFVLTLMPTPPNFVERYEEAVSTLALVDPILAFRLRGLPLIGPLLAQLRGLAALKQVDSEFWSRIGEPKMFATIIQPLEESILDVARAHGWRTWWQARSRLKRPTLSEGDRAQISDLLTKLKATCGTAAGP